MRSLFLALHHGKASIVAKQASRQNQHRCKTSIVAKPKKNMLDYLTCFGRGVVIFYYVDTYESPKYSNFHSGQCLPEDSKKMTHVYA